MDSNIKDNLEKNDAKPTRISGEAGSVGLSRYGGYVYEDFIANLRMPTSLKVYKEMSWNDATIGGILFLFESMMRKLHWEVEPGGDRKSDRKLADFVKENMNDMEHSWTDFITEVLSMFTYGWSWHEIVYKKRNSRNSKYPDGRIAWAKLPIRSQNSWNNWVYDENDKDKLLGMAQLDTNVGNIITIPYEKSLLFRTKMYRNSPEGVSMLRNAYRSWYFKKKIEEIEGIGIERDLAGLPVIYVPVEVDLWNKDNPESVILKAHLEKLISNIRRDKNEGALLPDTYRLELLTTGSSRQFDTNKIIERYDRRIAVTVLADIILMGHEKSGSFALAKSKTDMLGGALEAVADSILDVINTQAIPPLIDLNTFTGYTAYPKMVRGEIEKPDIDKIADAMERFRKMGMPFFPHEKTENFVRECLGVPKLSEEERKKLKAESEAEESVGDKDDKPLSSREREEHQTDDKDSFNQVYEEEGMKKIWNMIKNMFNKKGE